MTQPTFTTPFGRYVCEGDSITAQHGAFTLTATVYRDDCSDKPEERQDGFWPSRDKDAAGYVLPENFDAAQAKAEKVMAAWLNAEWFYCGVAVVVSFNGKPLTDRFANALWGVECNYPDSDNEYLREVANDLVEEALADAEEFIANLNKAAAEG